MDPQPPWLVSSPGGASALGHLIRVTVIGVAARWEVVMSPEGETSDRRVRRPTDRANDVLQGLQEQLRRPDLQEKDRIRLLEQLDQLERTLRDLR
jgi:hypothetical protein